MHNQRLVAVHDNELRAELALARATFDYTDQLIVNLEDHLQSGAAAGSRPRAGSEAEARVRLNELRSARDLEQAKIAALEAQGSGHTLYAPCDCLVWWSRGRTGGEWVRKGDKVLTLVQPEPQALMVEALVHLSEVEGLAPGQQALVELPAVAEPIAARIATIALESERQPRAGFPDWLRQDQSLASVLLVAERPLSADLIGLPAEVTFTTSLSPAWLVATLDDGAAEVWGASGTGSGQQRAGGVAPPADRDLVMSIPSADAARKVWADDQH